jgi:peroxiredoxin family protein
MEVAMVSNKTEKITLKLSVIAKLLLAIDVVVLVFFASYIAYILIWLLNTYRGTPDFKQIGSSLLAIIFSGGFSILCIRILTRTSGCITIAPDGLILDTYFTVGFIRWSNLIQINSISLMGIKHLGIAINDVDAYIVSKKHISGLMKTKEQASIQGFIGIISTFVPIKACNVILSIFGYTKFPESLSEANILRWNKENYGYHILIGNFLIPNLNEVIAKISVHQSASPASSIPKMKGEPLSTDYKKCPMCAEYIRADARICRFCRYSFDA